jgi:hypothetical protein
MVSAKVRSTDYSLRCKRSLKSKRSQQCIADLSALAVHAVKGAVSRDTLLQFFFHKLSSPRLLLITLGSFQIFSKIPCDIRKSRCTTGVIETGISEIYIDLRYQQQDDTQQHECQKKEKHQSPQGRQHQW